MPSNATTYERMSARSTLSGRPVEALSLAALLNLGLLLLLLAR
jgi:hypothetical protein